MKNLYLHDYKIKEILMEQNENFKCLDRKHQEFDQRLQEINSQCFITDNEWIEVKNLKKEKLRVKDSMQQYIFEYRRDHAVFQERR